MCRQGEIRHFIKETIQSCSPCILWNDFSLPAIKDSSWTHVIFVAFIYKFTNMAWLTCCTHNILYVPHMTVSLPGLVWFLYSGNRSIIHVISPRRHMGMIRSQPERPPRDIASIWTPVISSFPSCLDCVAVEGQFDLTSMHSWSRRYKILLQLRCQTFACRASKHVLSQSLGMSHFCMGHMLRLGQSQAHGENIWH